jgi:hypothetical protein
MSILEAGRTCLFRRQAGNVYSEDKQSMFTLEAVSPCLLESGSLCMF